MDLRRDELTRIARAPAKLNLFLEITGRRDDGFHELETLIVPIQLADSLSLTATLPPDDGSPGQIILGIRSGMPARSQSPRERVPTGADNLVARALNLLQQQSNSRFGARVELVKRIPTAAGLGGGSSDAAAALRLANRAWRLDWSTDRLSGLAAELGSDVPFFLTGGAALCRGRGERIEPLPAMPRLDFVVVKPDFGLNTSDVYRAHDAMPEAEAVPDRRNSVPADLASLRWGRLGQWMFNRLQAAAASLTPWVERARSAFDELDFVGHQLSGSGSGYFGVCRHAQHARRLATILRTRQLGLVYATRSCQ